MVKMVISPMFFVMFTGICMVSLIQAVEQFVASAPPLLLGTALRSSDGTKDGMGWVFYAMGFLSVFYGFSMGFLWVFYGFIMTSMGY